jgi:hypothetical protein
MILQWASCADHFLWVQSGYWVGWVSGHIAKSFTTQNTDEALTARLVVPFLPRLQILQ